MGQQEVANPLLVPFTGTWAEEQGSHCSKTAPDPFGTKNLQRVEGWVLFLLLALLRIYLSFNKSFPAEGESSSEPKLKNLLLVSIFNMKYKSFKDTWSFYLPVWSLHIHWCRDFYLQREKKKNLLVPHSTRAARGTMKNSDTDAKGLFSQFPLKFLPLTKHKPENNQNNEQFAAVQQGRQITPSTQHKVTVFYGSTFHSMHVLKEVSQTH